MSAGYHVILGDLAAAASCFAAEGKEVASLQQAMNPPMAETGDATLDDSLSGVLASVSALQAGLARKLAAHAQALKTCHDNYVSSDADVERLFNTVLGAYS
jgi:hypothetical protein